LSVDGVLFPQDSLTLKSRLQEQEDEFGHESFEGTNGLPAVCAFKTLMPKLIFLLLQS